MEDLVHRYAPSGARRRALLALLAGLPGIVLFAWGLVALTAVPAEPLWVVLALLLPGSVLSAVGAQLGRGIVGEAEAAPREANPVVASRRHAAERAASDDPAAVLKDRYVRGELDEEEFDRRMSRLLESEDERTRAVERER